MGEADHQTRGRNEEPTLIRLIPSGCIGVAEYNYYAGHGFVHNLDKFPSGDAERLPLTLRSLYRRGRRICGDRRKAKTGGNIKKKKTIERKNNESQSETRSGGYAAPLMYAGSDFDEID